MHTTTRHLGPSLAIALSIAPTLGCGAGAEDAPCDYERCDPTDEDCVREVAEVLACRRGVPAITPEVRFLSREEAVAENTGEPLTDEELQDLRDYYNAEALVGLMPVDYEPADVTADVFDSIVAYYSRAEREIVIIEDSRVDDPAAAFEVLVHELVHAFQDAEWELQGLYDEHATSVDRLMGLRAMLEGDASLYAALSTVSLAGVELTESDWARYFDDYQGHVLELAQESETPSLDMLGLFPYAFGIEYMYEAWRDGDYAGVEGAALDPADSVRQVLRGYPGEPRPELNGDALLDAHALPTLDGYTALSGGHQGIWLINAMLQRTAASADVFAVDALDRVDADYLIALREQGTGALATVWRISPAAPLLPLIDAPGSLWTLDPATPSSHVARVVDDDLVLVATTGDDADAVFNAITGWQPLAEFEPRVRARGDATRRGCPGRVHEPRAVTR
ncbi:MAG: hypothetical protein H6713_13180 [Myxococcales bacterium]|nr:hypothetical protein [Myxococcales bacterium]MCB9750934.1 hypothetical protein [Myxococcales bacterium]